MSLNCNSLKSVEKQAEFYSLIELHEPNIILGCESKLDQSIASYSVFPPNFEVFRKDRNVSGGGVFIAVRDDLIANPETSLASEYECIWISIQCPIKKKLYIREV